MSIVSPGAERTGYHDATLPIADDNEAKAHGFDIINALFTAHDFAAYIASVRFTVCTILRHLTVPMIPSS